MFKRVVFFLFISLGLLHVGAIHAKLPEGKNKFFNNADSLHTNRLIGVCASQSAVWVSSMVALNKAWYANYPRSSFHLFKDGKEWNQVDKVGHAWSAYWGAQFSSSLFRWAGVNRKRASLYGAGMGIAYLSVIEILDGYSANWGFSLGDMVANASGSALYTSQEYAWSEQRIQFKFSAHGVKYPDAIAQKKASDLYGSSLAEKILKDYNGQTYWLSANLWSFRKNSKLPKWLNIAVGYGADGLLGGFNNLWTDKQTGIVYDRRDIQRLRQFYFSPDIDLSKVTIRGKSIGIFRILNGIKLKFPMPTLEVNSNGKLKGYWFYF